MIAPLFNAWERRLASVDTDRVVRPFEWGLDWLPLEANGHGSPLSALREWSRTAVADSERFFGSERHHDFELTGDVLRFPSALSSPFPVNDTVVARVFRPEPGRAHGPRRAVVVLPQWNADADGHAGLCRLFARFGLTAVRLSLPYHEARRPDHLTRADYIVSSNIGRTLHANRQAVLDARRVVDWLEDQGFERIGIMGTSLGSCLSMLTMAHEPRIRAGAFNHVSPYFADVVWRGMSTEHVRAGLQGHVDLDDLRDVWMPISPWPFIDRVQGRQVLLVYARYDQTFPVDLSRKFLEEFSRRGVSHDTTVLPCGHYTTGKTPFKYLDGYALTKFFVKRL
jgi:dienelactone hydrolase